jgi:putative SOS response-associated peptidase YedK
VYAKWLDPTNDNPSELLSALRTDEFEVLAVNPAMSNGKNKTEEACSIIADEV